MNKLVLLMIPSFEREMQILSLAHSHLALLVYTYMTEAKEHTRLQ